MEVTFERMIDAGCGGKKNEDAYWVKKADYQGKCAVLAMVCDGVGGAGRGDLASQKTIDYLVGGFWSNLPLYLEQKYSMKQLGQIIEKYLRRANEKLYEEAKTNGYITGTTVALYFMLGDEYMIFNVGDSRVYWEKKKGFYRTRDHTWYERKKHEGGEREKHLLWQSIGSQRRLCPDLYTGQVENNMRILLVTDGAYRSFDKNELRIYCRNGNLRHMKRMAKKRKEQDNMTGVRIEIRETSKDR